MSVVEVGAHITSTLLVGATAIVISATFAFFVARKYGGSRRQRDLIFLLVGAFGLLIAGGLMYLQLRSKT